MYKKRLTDGAINFKNLKYLPTLVFTIEEDYADYESQEYLENWEYTILDYISYRQLKNDIEEFNKRISDIAYALDNNPDYYILTEDLLVSIKGGYYEGYQLWVDDRNFDYIEDSNTKEKVLLLYKDFFKKVKEDYNLTSIRAGWVSCIVDSKYSIEDSIKFKKFIKEVISNIKETINLFIYDTGSLNTFYPEFRENRFIINVDENEINSSIINKLLRYLNTYIYDKYGIIFRERGNSLVSRESFTPNNI